MGSTNWSTDAYKEAARLRKAAGMNDFAYSDATRSSGRWSIHPTLDLKGVTFRESRDSDAHPQANAVSVLFDETGSMGNIPRVFQQRLGTLMHVLLIKGYLQDPQILFGAFGDATCDRLPLQVGQFESGVEMDENLRNIVLEGNGGGNCHESYELPLYFLARHTAIDCWEKRGRKGYAFLIGDEMAYPFVNKQQVEWLIGDKLPEDVSLPQIISEVQQRYHLFFIFPLNANHGHDERIKDFWRNILGQHVIFLDDENSVSETIALAIGLTEDAINLAEGAEDLSKAGASEQAINVATRALEVYAHTKQVARVTGTNLPLQNFSAEHINHERL
ncbi:hypothetical protein EPA93_00915 [Ktedonosporobacter rubrisoli]|uniref:VWA domain-containing protein n=1 Tax=Ktedonosporobacter rubrisoli TaxID=2509675 RepID=A0A4P6JIZ0_KTERU|nr:hypothetical protein [Ktedonosporobacter rubrisoli]QBD74626.1 hypothetical protein EPA93_00915 [Ktedonosporobacter rubrisoli]